MHMYYAHSVQYEYSQYKVYHYFLFGSILFGGLKPPPSPNDAPPLVITDKSHE